MSIYVVVSDFSLLSLLPNLFALISDQLVKAFVFFVIYLSFECKQNITNIIDILLNIAMISFGYNLINELIGYF